MSEYIKIRREFSDVDLGKTACVDYSTFREMPQCTDYRCGEKRTIVLRNKATCNLELIRYTLIGGIPFCARPGYYWFWGSIETDNDNSCCYLVFCFKNNGKLARIFCGKSPSVGLNSWDKIA